MKAYIRLSSIASSKPSVAQVQEGTGCKLVGELHSE